MKLSSLTEKMISAAREAAGFIMAEADQFNREKIERKGRNDFVSYVDRRAEEILVRSLEKLLPGSGFVAEENRYDAPGGRFSWVIDPLDGTTNFIHNIHPFAVSIALREYDEIISGVVFEASGEEIFSAWQGGGAWLNGKRIRVSETASASESLVATGFPYTDFSRLPCYLKCLDFMLRNTRGVRRMGSASIDLAYVACGRYDAFFEYSLKPWDVGAGIILVREAGGITSDFKGNRAATDGDETIAANNIVYREFFEIISKFMRR